jgi:hypothetical protein
MKPRYLGLTLLALLTAGCDVYSRHATTQFDIAGDVRDVDAHEGTLLVAADSSLLTYDISVPDSPRALRVVPLGRRANCLLVIDGAVYVGTDSGVAVRPISRGTDAELFCGGTGQSVAALTADSTRLYAATADGITVFDLDSGAAVKYIPMAGEPTGVARHDSRLFVSLNDWGVRVFNMLPGDSFALDTLKLGEHCRAEGVTASPGGYLIISMGNTGVRTYYYPNPDSFPSGGGGGGGNRSAYGVAATDGVEQAAFYLADSTTVSVTQIINRPGTFSLSEEIGPDLQGFTRRICLGGNGYVYTASGDAGIYIIRE